MRVLTEPHFRGSLLFERGAVHANARQNGAPFSLSEISGCSWDPRDPSHQTLLLVGDAGLLFSASIHIEDGVLVDVRPQWRQPLTRPSHDVDSEGIAFSASGELLISTERHQFGPTHSVLDVAAFNLSDGFYAGSKVHIPDYVRDGSANNKGFEALTTVLDGELIITSTEVRLAFARPPPGGGAFCRPTSRVARRLGSAGKLTRPRSPAHARVPPRWRPGSASE